MKRAARSQTFYETAWLCPRERYSMQKNSGIGGQAVIEGIMMRNGDNYSIAVRKESGEISTCVKPYKSICGWKGVWKVPILRGVVSFVDSLVVGITSLTWSADEAVEEEDSVDAKEGKTSKPLTEEELKKQQEKEDRAWKWMMAGTVVFAIAFSVVLFMLLPFWLAGLLRNAGISDVLVNLAEAVLRLLIFFAYMLLISRMKDIQRTFSYHGAEHKCINCIEHNLALNVENVKASSRQHRRCGTSFMLIVIVISVIAFLILGLFGIESRLWRFLWRLILIPIIAGVSYELLRYAGSHENGVVNTLVKPGLALQKLVTREPDDAMCEVAITAVEAVFDWRAWQAEHGGTFGDTEDSRKGSKQVSVSASSGKVSGSAENKPERAAMMPSSRNESEGAAEARAWASQQ